MLELIDEISTTYKTVFFISAAILAFGYAIYKKFHSINNSRDKHMDSNPKKQTDKFSDDYIKSNIHVLFIDDHKYAVTELLIKNGWKHVRLVHEIESISDQIVKDSDIILVDVIGVGINLGFQDQGYGLASALKDYYPDKKIIIYSQERNEFNEALKKVDSIIKKTSSIYTLESELISLYKVEKNG